MAGLHQLPPQREVEDALLHLLSSRKAPYTAREAYDALADHFELTWEQTRRRRPNEAREIEWNNLVRLARQQLVEEGKVTNDTRNQWGLTDNWRALLTMRIDVSGIRK